MRVKCLTNVKLFKYKKIYIYILYDTQSCNFCKVLSLFSVSFFGGREKNSG